MRLPSAAAAVAAGRGEAAAEVAKDARCRAGRCRGAASADRWLSRRAATATGTVVRRTAPITTGPVSLLASTPASRITATTDIRTATTDRMSMGTTAMAI